MKSGVLQKLLIAVACIGAIAIGIGLRFGFAAFKQPVATARHQVYSAGQKALFGCSGVFIANRSPADIERWELGYADMAVDGPGWLTVDREKKTATGHTMWGLVTRTAYYRDGFGCALVPPDGSPSSTTTREPRRLPDLSRVPWPDGDDTGGAPLPGEVNTSVLDTAMNGIFDGKTYFVPEMAWMPDAKTIGVVIVYKGQIIAERYAEGWDEFTPYRTYSTAKSFSNTLAGLRVLDGKLDIDRPAIFKEWADAADPRSKITLRNVLNMSSGLECDTGREDPLSLRLYFDGGLNAETIALGKKLIHPPGTHWCYSNYEPISVGLVVGRTFDDHQEWMDYPRQRLLDRIGMWHTTFETDAYDNFILSSQIWTTPRDLARLGLLYLHDGVWHDERLLPEGWVEFTASPAPPTRDWGPNLGSRGWGYGAQWWLLNKVDGIPADAFTTGGHGGQYTTVIPSRDLVIVRMGLQDYDHNRFIRDVLSALGMEKKP